MTLIEIEALAEDRVTTKTYAVTVARAPFQRFFGNDATGSAALLDGVPAPNGTFVKAVLEPVKEEGKKIGGKKISEPIAKRLRQ